VELVEPIDAGRFMPPVDGVAPPAPIKRAADLLREAKHPLILAGRVSRDLNAWNTRIALAERLGARVATDLKVAAAFPTDHRLHVGSPSTIGIAAPAPHGIRGRDRFFGLVWADFP